MPLQLSLRSVPDLPVDVRSLRPERLQTMTLGDIQRLPLSVGNQDVHCRDLFDVRGTAEDEQIILSGDCRRLTFIGAEMTSGTIIVESSAGAHLGARLRGGTIRVQGNAGHWAGAEMRRGTVEIQGNAGDSLGAAYPGAAKGMRGGRIFVRGQAGNEIGAGMRRGLIAIAKQVGVGAGAGMIAGTICLLGGAGTGTGLGMKRGTILLSGSPESTGILPTFIPTAITRPVYLRLLVKELRLAGFTVPTEWDEAAFQCFRGDLLELGLGELFFPVA